MSAQISITTQALS
jgi:malate synthase